MGRAAGPPVVSDIPRCVVRLQQRALSDEYLLQRRCLIVPSANEAPSVLCALHYAAADVIRPDEQILEPAYYPNCCIDSKQLKRKTIPTQDESET